MANRTIPMPKAGVSNYTVMVRGGGGGSVTSLTQMENAAANAKFQASYQAATNAAMQAQMGGGMGGGLYAGSTAAQNPYGQLTGVTSTPAAWINTPNILTGAQYVTMPPAGPAYKLQDAEEAIHECWTAKHGPMLADLAVVCTRLVNSPTYWVSVSMEEQVRCDAILSRMAHLRQLLGYMASFREVLINRGDYSPRDMDRIETVIHDELAEIGDGPVAKRYVPAMKMLENYVANVCQGLRAAHSMGDALDALIDEGMRGAELWERMMAFAVASVRIDE